MFYLSNDLSFVCLFFHCWHPTFRALETWAIRESAVQSTVQAGGQSHNMITSRLLRQKSQVTIWKLVDYILVRRPHSIDKSVHTHMRLSHSTVQCKPSNSILHNGTKCAKAEGAAWKKLSLGSSWGPSLRDSFSKLSKNKIFLF